MVQERRTGRGGGGSVVVVVVIMVSCSARETVITLDLTVSPMKSQSLPDFYG